MKTAGRRMSGREVSGQAMVLVKSAARPKNAMIDRAGPFLFPRAIGMKKTLAKNSAKYPILYC
ncbi:MAG: hypothetical protein M1355_02330 [Patescibacteria group bacterium]|nr:hypothetical protein [Patescibacteria group bacterium]